MSTILTLNVDVKPSGPERVGAQPAEVISLGAKREERERRSGCTFRLLDDGRLEFEIDDSIMTWSVEDTERVLEYLRQKHAWNNHTRRKAAGEEKLPALRAALASSLLARRRGERDLAADATVERIRRDFPGIWQGQPQKERDRWMRTTREDRADTVTWWHLMREHEKAGVR